MREAPLSHWFVRAPDHLGDGVLARPLVSALSQGRHVTVGGPPWCADLYGDLDLAIGPPAPPVGIELAVLCKPAFRAAWNTRHVPRRVGWPTDHRAFLLTERVVPPHGHRLDAYAALGEAVGVPVSGPPSIPCRPDGAGGVVLLPFSASGPPVEWTGYRSLANALHAQGCRVRFCGGPGDEARLAQLAGPHPVVPTLGVSDVMDVLAGADVVVGNDSGLTHLAAAARRGSQRPVAHVVGIAGSTSPSRTGAPGALWLQAPPPDCAPCYRKRCHRDLSCLQLSVEHVLEAVRKALA